MLAYHLAILSNTSFIRKRLYNGHYGQILNTHTYKFEPRYVRLIHQDTDTLPISDEIKNSALNFKSKVDYHANELTASQFTTQHTI